MHLKNIDLGELNQESFDIQVFVHAQLLTPIVRIQFEVCQNYTDQ